MPEVIDPQASEKREMQQRGANLQFAGQFMLAMAQGRPEILELASPEGLFEYAIAVADQMRIYINRPFDEPSRLVS